MTSFDNFNNLVIQNHPIKGRIIMNKDKYDIYFLEKHKERETKLQEN